MSLLTLSIVFSALTLVLVTVLVYCLRRCAAGARRAAREEAEDAPLLVLKEEE